MNEYFCPKCNVILKPIDNISYKKTIFNNNENTNVKNTNVKNTNDKNTNVKNNDYISELGLDYII